MRRDSCPPISAPRAYQAAIAALFIGVVALAAPVQAATVCCKPDNCPQLAYRDARVALVVGVDSYSGRRDVAGDGLVDLDNSVKDAIDIATILAPYYSVRCVLNPTAEEFLKELDALAGHLQALQSGPPDGLYQNSIILHFSGHGSRIGGEDHIFLSGKYATLAEARNEGAVRVEHIAEQFQRFAHFEKTFIFDACRNFMNGSNNPVKPSWLQSGFGKPEEHQRAWQTIVYSTENGRLAYDKNASIGATDNGAFVFNLKKYFQFHGMELAHVLQMIAADPTMVSIQQKPTFSPSNLFSPAAWTRKAADQCRLFETSAAREANSCRMSPAAPACMTLHVCREINKMDGLPDNCSSQEIRTVFSEMTCPVTTPGTPVAELFGVTRVATTTPELSEMRREALLNSSQQRFERMAAVRPIGDRAPASDEPTPESVTEMVGRLETIARVAGRTSAPRDAVSTVRIKILGRNSQITFPKDTFNVRATAPLEVLAGNIELYNVPGAGGGTTGRLKPTGQPKVDCETQYCDANWVMVRVPVGKKTVDGWLPANRVTPRKFTATAEISFNDRDLMPSLDSRAELNGFIETAKGYPNGVVRIIAVIPAPANDETRILAAARATQLKNLLDGRAAPINRITMQVIETGSPGAQASVTVGLLNP